MDKRILLLHPSDNVYVVCQSFTGRERIAAAEGEILIPGPVDVGHKVARRAIDDGEPVIKYGVPIGSATRALVAGEHVHLHNMRSDYIASHARGGRV
ncbi:MAG: UxaA family hydrolase [Halioglobus sp.]|nr:UxaA family hydrolase [Halioglobus sp.]